MANTIGALVIDLVANTAQFSTDLKGAVKSVEDGVGRIKDAFAILGGVFASAGIAELALQTIDFGNELQKAAAKTGVGGQAISELAFAARAAGVDLGQLTAALARMQKSISDAGTGTSQPLQDFQALGISFEQLKALAPDQQFELIANQISRLKDPADRGRVSIDLFGRAAAELLPLFMQGAAGIEEARQKAQAFGQSFGDQQLKAFHDAKTSIDELKESASAFATVLVGAVAPSISKFINSITDAVTGNEVNLLTKQIEELQGRLAYVQQEPGGSPMIQILQDQIAAAQAQLGKLNGDLKNFGISGSGWDDEKPPPGFINWDKILPAAQITAVKARFNSLTSYFDDLDTATQTSVEADIQRSNQFFAQLQQLTGGVDGLQQALISPDEAKKRSAEFLDNLLPEAQVHAKYLKFQELSYKDFEQIASYAKAAGDEIQSSFATAFENIGKGGLNGLIADFLNAFKKIFAEAAAFDIAKALGIQDAFRNQGGGSALGGIFSGLSALFGGGAAGADTGDYGYGPGFATGGSFAVGGNGGTDSQLVQFRASPGEQVTINPPGQRAGGSVVFSPTYNIGSGVSRSDVISACQTTQKTTIAQISRLIKGGAFA